MLVTAFWRTCFLKIGTFVSLLWWVTCSRGLYFLASSLNHLCLSNALNWAELTKAFLSLVWFFFFLFFFCSPNQGPVCSLCICDSLASTCTLNLLHKSLYKGEKAPTWNLWSLRFAFWLRWEEEGLGYHWRKPLLRVDFLPAPQSWVTLASPVETLTSLW